MGYVLDFVWGVVRLSFFLCSCFCEMKERGLMFGMRFVGRCILRFGLWLVWIVVVVGGGRVKILLLFWLMLEDDGKALMKGCNEKVLKEN